MRRGRRWRRLSWCRGERLQLIGSCCALIEPLLKLKRVIRKRLSRWRIRGRRWGMNWSKMIQKRRRMTEQWRTMYWRVMRMVMHWRRGMD